MRIDDPSADAAIILALISSLKDIPVPMELIVMGEIGLAGEFRSVPSIDLRISEASRLGFSQIAVPDRQKSASYGVTGMRGIYDALRILAKSQQDSENKQ